MITAIVAIAENFAIGKDGRLSWHYPADLKFFKETTLGHAVVMGFRTWESIGRPLPKRLNIVLSRSKTIDERDDVLVLRKKSEVLTLVPYLKGDLFIIGGAQTYAEFAGAIEKWIVTEIPETVANADAFMPADFLDGFELRQTIEFEKELRVKIYRKLL